MQLLAEEATSISFKRSVQHDLEVLATTLSFVPIDENLFAYRDLLRAKGM
jgi:hypothetical protein